MVTKTCTKCGSELELFEFYKHKYGKQGRTSQCKYCISKYRKKVRILKRSGTYISRVREHRLTKEQRLKRREEIRIYQMEYRKKNREIISQKKKEYCNRIKTKGIEHYGGKCTCCGESIQEFLTVDHVHGRTTKEKRQKNFRGKKMWLRAKSEGYPDKYTVLCFNCNCAKGAFGFCPHEKK